MPDKTIKVEGNSHIPYVCLISTFRGARDFYMEYKVIVYGSLNNKVTETASLEEAVEYCKGWGRKDLSIGAEWVEEPKPMEDDEFLSMVESIPGRLLPYLFHTWTDTSMFSEEDMWYGAMGAWMVDNPTTKSSIEMSPAMQ